jgi:lysophospholipase L1-like esterase
MRIAEAAIPILKPRWIIVGLLQGDDLNQSMSPKPEHEAIAAPLINALYPTLSELKTSLSSAEKPSVITAPQARAEWQRRSRSLLASLKPDQRRRFERLPRALRKRYLDGDLNPYVVELAAREPNYFSWLLDESNPSVQKKVSAMAEQLSRIKEMAGVNDARVVAVSIPNWPYVTHSASARRLGFDLRQEMLRTTAPDDESRQACEASGIEQIAVTEEIRRRAAQSGRFYYPVDGHFTAEGQRAFAEAIAPEISSVLTSGKR